MSDVCTVLAFKSASDAKSDALRRQSAIKRPADVILLKTRIGGVTVASIGRVDDDWHSITAPWTYKLIIQQGQSSASADCARKGKRNPCGLPTGN